MHKIIVQKTQTKLLCDNKLVCTSKGREDHTAHVLAWCDSNGIRVENDPRFPSVRGTWTLVDGVVVR